MVIKIKHQKKNKKNLNHEAGIAYGLGKKCYAIGEYEATDTLYNIFDEIFPNLSELEKFLSKYNKMIN